MINYVTRSGLQRFASEIPVAEQATLRRSASARDLNGSTFLSHSSKDEDLVVGAIRVLDGHGAKVYVDEIDPQMPPYTSDETAALLKSCIHQTSRFVLLASKNSKDSRWVPWEFGIADGDKALSRTALFPASDDSSEEDWASWEYLGLYRRIVWGNMEGYKDPIWMVLDEKKNTATKLSEWLKGA